MTASAPFFADRVRSALERRVPATVHEEAAQRASVALVVTSGADAALLFVKRQEREGDPWSGHAALPGGFRSPSDVTPAATAERETEEETGLPLAAAGRLLGQLDDQYPRSVHLPKVVVTPFVFEVPSRLPVSASPEVQAALWVPVDQVLSAASRRPFLLSKDGVQMEFESIHAGGLVIWGLTERILSQLSEVVASFGK